MTNTIKDKFEEMIKEFLVQNPEVANNPEWPFSRAIMYAGFALGFVDGCEAVDVQCPYCKGSLIVMQSKRKKWIIKCTGCGVKWYHKGGEGNGNKSPDNPPVLR